MDVNPQTKERTDLASQIGLFTGEPEVSPSTAVLTGAELDSWIRTERIPRARPFDGFDDFGPTGGDFGDW